MARKGKGSDGRRVAKGPGSLREARKADVSEMRQRDVVTKRIIMETLSKIGAVPVRRTRDHTPIENTPRMLEPANVPYNSERPVSEKTRAVSRKYAGQFMEPERSDARKRDDAPHCKERPEPGRKRPGGGASRSFVPWCSRKR